MKSKNKFPGPKPRHDIPPPVITGKDKRAEERSVRPEKRESDAPDGVTGNWS